MGYHMSTTNFNLRGITTDIMMMLKKEADKQNTSVNLLILRLIEHGIGHVHAVKKPIFHDLDKLAGTWSEKDAKEFLKNTKEFEKIDKELWS